MAADCHIHMVLDGVWWRDAIARHREKPDEAWIRARLSEYREGGFTFLRDGGDAFGASALAARLAPEYGIDYRTPLFPIHRAGRYGGFIGRAFDDMASYRALVDEVKRGGGDFIKIMISGLMDFSEYGRITSEPLKAAEIAEMIRIAHGEGFAVMAHANGAATVRAALDAGVDSVEHGSYMDGECLRELAVSDAVWVPTAVTIGNLLGKGRYPEDVVRRILKMQLANVREAAALGAKLAVGSDAGAWRVFHGQGARDELVLLRGAIGPGAEDLLAAGLAEIEARFHR